MHAGRRRPSGQIEPLWALVFVFTALMLTTAGYGLWRFSVVQDAVSQAAQYGVSAMQVNGCYTGSTDSQLANLLGANGIPSNDVAITVTTDSTPVQYGYNVGITVTAAVPIIVLFNQVLWVEDAKRSAELVSQYLPGNATSTPTCTAPTMTSAQGTTGSYQPSFEPPSTSG